MGGGPPAVLSRRSVSASGFVISSTVPDDQLAVGFTQFHFDLSVFAIFRRSDRSVSETVEASEFFVYQIKSVMELLC